MLYFQNGVALALAKLLINFTTPTPKRRIMGLAVLWFLIWISSIRKQKIWTRDFMIQVRVQSKKLIANVLHNLWTVPNSLQIIEINDTLGQHNLGQYNWPNWNSWKLINNFIVCRFKNFNSEIKLLKWIKKKLYWWLWIAEG